MKTLAACLIFLISSLSYSQVCQDYETGIMNVRQTCQTMWAEDSSNYSCSSGIYSSLKAEYISLPDGQAQFKCHAALCSNGNDVMFNVTPIPSCASMLDVKKSNLNFESQVTCPGSIINVDNEVLGETIPLVGASFSLNYFSNYSHRIADYKAVVLPVDVFPTGISNVIVNFIPGLFPSLGTTFNYSQRPVSDIVYSWDGNDDLGNSMWGSLLLQVQMSEDRQFFNYSNTIPFSYYKSLSVGSFNAKKLGIGVWVPSIYRFYDQQSNTLFRGDGSRRNVTASLNSNNVYVVPEADGSLVHEFNSLGMHLNTKLGITGQIIYTFSYDSSNRLVSITEPYSRVTTFNRDSNGKLLSITAPNNKTSSVVIDSAGFLASVTNPKSESYSMTYNSRGLLLSFQKPNTAVSTFTYDSEDKLKKDEHSGGFFQDLVVLTDENTIKQQSLTSKMGRTRTVENRPFSSPTQKMTQPDDSSEDFFSGLLNSEGDVQEHHSYNGATYYSEAYHLDQRFALKTRSRYHSQSQGVINRTTSYSENFNLTTFLDPFSIIDWVRTATTGTATTNITYTASNKTFVTTSPLSRTQTLQWDNYQRPVSVQQGNLSPTTFSYTNDQLTSVAQGSRVTTFAYNPTTGNVSSITNPLSQTTSYTYDLADRLTSMTLPDSRVINFLYNSNGDLKTVTPASRPVHTFNFNSSELVDNYVPPSLVSVPNVTTSYSYNDDKQLTQILKPDGQAIDFGYNTVNGKLTSLTTPKRTVTYGYLNANSQYNTRTYAYPNGTLRVEYDGRIPVSVETNYANGAYSMYTYTTDPTYGYLKSDKVDSNGNTSIINYGYDLDELLTSAGSLTLAYDTPNGQLTGTTLGSVTDTYTYNTLGELLTYQGKISGVNSYGYTLTRDSLGRIATKSQVMPGVGTDNYEYFYDSSGRLIQVKKNSVVVSNYGYDDNNNRVSGNVGSQTTTSTIDNQDRVATYNTYTYVYNASGYLQSKTNTVTNQVTSYSYDALGNLWQVNLPNGSVVTYEIDAFNRRVGKSLNGVLQRRYFYIDQYRIGAEINPNGTILRRYVYGSKGNIPDYYIQSGANYKIFSDHLGSFRMSVRQSNGAIQCKQDHDEFGQVILNTSPGCVVFGYAGGLYDEDTKLVRFGARDYDPTIGRWTTKDPIGFAGGDTNLYAYVGGDPMSYIDPTGHFGIIGGAVGFLSGAIGGYTAGGFWGGVVGSVAGGVVGVAFPASSGIAGGMAAGALSNALGQVLGNGISDKSLLSIDVGQVIASGFSGALGASAGAAFKAVGVVSQVGIGMGADGLTNILTAPFHTGPVDFCRVGSGKTCTLDQVCGGGK